MVLLRRKTTTSKKQSVAVEAPPAQCFWVHNGPILKNIAELGEALRRMSDEQFVHHVNRQKNDFAKWIVDVLQLSALAHDLHKATTRKAAIKALEKHLR